MGLEIIINASDEEDRVAIFLDGVFSEFMVERKDEPSRVGNIYKGKVKRVIKGMDAAFVDIGLKRDAFLYLSETTFDDEFGGVRLDLRDFIQVGQSILVQVTKEATSTKGAKVTSQITLPGYYLVLLPTYRHIGVSKRITSQEERMRLIRIMERIVPPEMGAIARTNAQGKDPTLLEAEILRLVDRWEGISRLSKKRSQKNPLYEELPLIKRIFRDLITEDIDRVIVDSQAHYEDIIGFLGDYGMGHLSSNITLYSGLTPIFDAFGIEEKVKDLLSKKVWLKSGGYIIIDEVEALVTIDVNTGRYVGGGNLEETILRVNLEAAKEVARQLRLRNLGGIIVVDFIDMKDEENRRKVIATLEQELSKDRLRSNLFEITKLGLVEITRKRVHSSLDELMREDCPICRGEGRILSKRSLEIEIIRRIRNMSKGLKKGRFLVKLNPIAYEELIESKAIEDLVKELGIKVTLSKDDRLRWEEIEVLTL